MGAPCNRSRGVPKSSSIRPVMRASLIDGYHYVRVPSLYHSAGARQWDSQAPPTRRLRSHLSQTTFNLRAGAKVRQGIDCRERRHPYRTCLGGIWMAGTSRMPVEMLALPATLPSLALIQKPTHEAHQQ